MKKPNRILEFIGDLIGALCLFGGLYLVMIILPLIAP